MHWQFFILPTCFEQLRLTQAIQTFSLWRTKPAQTKDLKCLELGGIIRCPYQRDDHHIIRQLSGTEQGHYGIGLKQADNAIQLRQAETRKTTQSKRQRSATYSIQHPGYNGGGTAKSEIVRVEGQPPISEAIRHVPNFDTPDDYQPSWRLGDFFRCQSLQFWGWAARSLSPLQSLTSARTEETNEENQHGDVLFKKRVSVAACLQSLWTNTPWSKRHPRPFHRLKLELIETELKVSW